MFSREESKKMRQEFWTSFGKNYPRKWLLYNTKIKELQLKFTFTTKMAQVSLDISSADEVIQEYYWEKVYALKTVLRAEYLPRIIFEKEYQLPEGKNISRLYVQLKSANIHRKSDWPKVQEFLNENMATLELFFLEFEDYLRD